MLIVLKQNNSDNLYAIWNTDTDRFLGVNMEYDDCIKAVMKYKGYIYEDAKQIVDHPHPFYDIAEHIYVRHDPVCTQDESKEIQNAVMLVTKHYEKDDYFRKAFQESVASALKEIPIGTGLYDVAEIISDRIMGKG